jgi:outer membrane protein insertion porin family
VKRACPFLFMASSIACGGGTPARTSEPNVVAVNKAAGAAPGASAPSCDARGAALDAEHAEGLRIVERCVTGGSAETKAAVEKALALGTDKPLTADALRRDLEAAYATGLVDQIEATARQAGSGCVLFLAITERPKISAVAFDGLVALKDDARVASFPKVGAPVSVPAISVASERLRSEYVAHGYEDAKVSHVIEPDGAGRARVKIAVAEGARSKVGKVTFDGVRGGREAGLRKAIELDEGSPLDPEKLTRAILGVAAFYYDNGFVNVRVEEPKRVRASDGTTSLSFAIVEGPLFRVGKLSVSKVDDATQKEILSALKVKSGEIFNRSKLKADLEALATRTRQKGKPLSADPETKVDPKAAVVDINLAIRESQ